ncbi:histidine kinase [Maribellus sp. YY47]|uniref:sensor histidine kinase n=1 Tax=Maribellus sp. YY47 TaxID=2929486 RepID=UPI0020006B45|nr:histidine kinase [Maribellus sp. YY47]MCK3686192.1 histidine kinase [Maribellus sp. YY47]
MKQLLFILIILLTSFSTTLAQNKDIDENEVWDIIRARLFGDYNSEAFRFEDDIHIQLKGSPNHEDSTIFQTLIKELNSLTETVEVKLVKNNANFIISILPPNDGLGLNQDMDTEEYVIQKVELDFNLRYINSYEEKLRDYYFYTIRSLTQLFHFDADIIGYGGIFYYKDKPEYIAFSDIDKEIIKKLYSKNFYRDLKQNTIKTYGYLYYWNIRYKSTLKFFLTFISIIIAAIGLLYMQSRYVKKTTYKLKDYFKTGFLVLILTAFIYWIFMLPAFISSKSTHYFSNLAFLILAYLPLGLIAIPFLYYSERFLLKNSQKFLQRQTIIFFTTIIAFLIGHLFELSIFVTLQHLNFTNISTKPGFISTTFALAACITAFLRVLFNWSSYRIQSMVNQKDVEIAKMKELKNQAELNALHSRINPHFLYNSLNSIASLAHIDADKTENMATGLSELFRYSINKENKTFVTVAEELEMVKKYLEIEKTRFGDKLVYEIDADESTREKQIPKFLIQPLVENAVKHGLSKIKAMGKITVEVRQLEKDLSISIFDNGPDFPAEPVSGYGLQNLHDKLDIIYGNDAGINWENGDNKHVRITLKNQFNQ